MDRQYIWLNSSTETPHCFQSVLMVVDYPYCKNQQLINSAIFLRFPRATIGVIAVIPLNFIPALITNEVPLSGRIDLYSIKSVRGNLTAIAFFLPNSNHKAIFTNHPCDYLDIVLIHLRSQAFHN